MSKSNLPAIILGVVVVAILVAFYIADRSSRSGSSDAMHSDNGNDDSYHSSGPHSGYSGSLKNYLKKY